MPKNPAARARISAALSVSRPARLKNSPQTPQVDPQRDLFGQIPVSTKEVELWLYSVPRMPHYDRHRVKYVKQYDVPGKIARAKEQGELAGLLEENCEYCGQPLCADLAPAPVNAWPSQSALEAELATLKRRVTVLQLILGRPDMKKAPFGGLVTATAF